MSDLGVSFPFVEIVNLVKKQEESRGWVKAVVLKVQFVDEQHQFHLGTS